MPDEPLTMTEDERSEKAAEEMRGILDKYQVTFLIDVETYDAPAFFLIPNELAGDRPPRLH